MVTFPSKNNVYLSVFCRKGNGTGSLLYQSASPEQPVHFIGISKMGAVAKRSRKQMHIQTLIEVFHLHISRERGDHLRVQI